MKLFRFGPEGAERPGAYTQDGSAVDVSGFGEDYDEAFLGNDGPARLAKWLAEDGANAPKVPDDARRAAPIVRTSKIICIGLNYVDHAAETGVDLPAEPVMFFKAPSALTGPNDGLLIPRGSEKTDYEVELAIVIGKRGKHIEEKNALDHVAGFALHNDYSEREWQLERSGQWVKGKSADTYAPLGPWIVTPDEFPQFQSVDLWLKVNGEERQRSNTAQMHVGVPGLVSYVSRFMSLCPGDVITTGTPAGVALGMENPTYLREGDVIELGIDGLGSQRQVAKQED